MTDHTIVLHDHDKSPADLVAEAIALVDYEIKQSQSMVNIFANMRLAGILQDGNLNEVAHEKNQYRRFLNSWLTHKAEFGDLIKKHEHYHDKVHDLEHETDCGLDELVTKAKRLLGVSK